MMVCSYIRNANQTTIATHIKYVQRFDHVLSKRRRYVHHYQPLCSRADDYVLGFVCQSVSVSVCSQVL